MPLFNDSNLPSPGPISNTPILSSHIRFVPTNWFPSNDANWINVTWLPVKWIIKTGPDFIFSLRWYNKVIWTRFWGNSDNIICCPVNKQAAFFGALLSWKKWRDVDEPSNLSQSIIQSVFPKHKAFKTFGYLHLSFWISVKDNRTFMDYLSEQSLSLFVCSLAFWGENHWMGRYSELYIECCAHIFSDVELIHEEIPFSGCLACTRCLAIWEDTRRE
jgi:hypothetical protein